jgi:hypothetical protein
MELDFILLFLLQMSHKIISFHGVGGSSGGSGSGGGSSSHSGSIFGNNLLPPKFLYMSIFIS